MNRYVYESLMVGPSPSFAVVVWMFIFPNLIGVRNCQAEERRSITIVALGDSTTAPRKVESSQNGRPEGPTTRGENADDSKNVPHNVVTTESNSAPSLYVYADVLRDKLRARGDANYSVDNEGIGGGRTDQALARLEADVLAKSPTWVVVQFGINDSWWDVGQPANVDQPDSSGSRVAMNSTAQRGGNNAPGNGNDHAHADRGNYVDNLTQVVQTLKAKNVRVILMTPNQLGYQGDAPWRNRLLAEYAEAAREIAQAERVPLVDVWNLFAEYASTPGKSLRDLLLDFEHPNAIGHRMIADALLAQIVGQKN